ncbi:MAG TPA: class I SAM-dependent methyltransferase [Candidatus Atribacteria bacterium]|nr:class I SAM-dependent methyltransferase [Candidatus Atribacteria bacterium]
MKKTKDYHNYTNYDKEPCGLKKLDFVVGVIKERKKKDAIILDLGCGNANVSFPLAFMGYNVIAVDISKRLIKKNARKNKFKNLKFQVVDINDIETYRSNFKSKFDIILCLDILEHLYDPPKLLKSVNNLCNSNGLLIVSIPNGYGFSELVSRVARNLEKILRIQFINKFKRKTGRFSIQSENYTPHVQKFTFNRFMQLLEHCGFKLVAHKNSTIFSSTLRWCNNPLEMFDCKLADRLPKSMVSGWCMAFEKVEDE